MNVLEELEARHGGRRLPAIRNKYRWKAPSPMRQGNTVTCVVNKDGSRVISATGRATEVTQLLIGAEHSTKLVGTNEPRTCYSIWHLNALENDKDPKYLKK